MCTCAPGHVLDGEACAGMSANIYLLLYYFSGYIFKVFSCFETMNNQILSSLLQHVCTFKGKLITNQADQRDLSTIKRETDKNLHLQSPATQTSVPPGIS